MSNGATPDVQQPTPAHAYQEYYGPAIFEPLADVVFDLITPERGDTVLDVACGTGIVTRRAATAVGPAGRVVGVDINPGMLRVAESIPAPDGSGEIEWLLGDATALDVPDATFDVVYCHQGLQFFPDRGSAVREMRRALDDGRVAIAVWRGIDRHPLFAAMADAEEPHLSALGVEITRAELEAPFSFGDQAELHGLLTDAGFSDVTIVERTIDARFADADRFVERMEFAYAAVIPQFAEDPAAFAAYLDAIGRDTKHIIDRYRSGDHIVVPMHTSIAIAS